MKNFLHRLLLEIVSFCSKSLGIFQDPFMKVRITSKDYREVQALLKPGQTLLSKKSGELSNLLIPGKYKHTAIVKDKNTVIEAVTVGGVKETDLIDFIMGKRSIALLEPLFATEEEMIVVPMIAASQKGLPYKFDMEFSITKITAFYCSMLNFYCYFMACKEMPFTLREILGVQNVAPSDFYEAKDKFKVIWESK